METSLLLLAYYLQIRNINVFLVSNLSNLKINCCLFNDGKGALINESCRHYRLGGKTSMVFAVSTLFCASLYKEPEAVFNILLSFEIDW